MFAPRLLAAALALWSFGCGSKQPAPVATHIARAPVVSSARAMAAFPAEGSAALPADPPPPCATHAGPKPVALPAAVTFGDFWAGLEAQIAALEGTALQGVFQTFAAQHALDASSPELWRDFVRLWVLFEATRDGGWWRLRWDITDQEPSSVKIWKAWFRQPPTHDFASESAVAECDEITALFAVTARRLGVRGVGLFYPTWNHVIAGWSPAARSATGANRVVLIPTTQIFQGCAATFDQTTFKPPKQVYEFPRVDVSDKAPLPASLAGFLLEQVRAYGEASPALLALIRAKRADMLGSSLGDCESYRRDLAARSRAALTCADRYALRHLAEHELKRPELSVDDTLTFLASSR